MPKPVDAYYRIAMEAAEQVAAEYFDVPPDDRCPTADFYVARDLTSAQSYIDSCPEVASINPAASLYGAREQHTEALKVLLSAAELDVGILYDAAYTFLTTQKIDDDEILPTIMRSDHLARQYAAVEAPRSRDLITRYSKAGKTPFILLRNKKDDAPQEVRFSPELYGIFLKPYTGKNIGCSALTQTVECPFTGKTTTVFDMHWQGLVARAYRNKTRRNT